MGTQDDTNHSAPQLVITTDVVTAPAHILSPGRGQHGAEPTCCSQVHSILLCAPGVRGQLSQKYARGTDVHIEAKPWALAAISMASNRFKSPICSSSPMSLQLLFDFRPSFRVRDYRRVWKWCVPQSRSVSVSSLQALTGPAGLSFRKRPDRR